MLFQLWTLVLWHVLSKTQMGVPSNHQSSANFSVIYLFFYMQESCSLRKSPVVFWGVSLLSLVGALELQVFSYHQQIDTLLWTYTLRGTNGLP